MGIWDSEKDGGFCESSWLDFEYLSVISSVPITAFGILTAWKTPFLMLGSALALNGIFSTLFHALLYHLFGYLDITTLLFCGFGMTLDYWRLKNLWYLPVVEMCLVLTALADYDMNFTEGNISEAQWIIITSALPFAAHVKYRRSWRDVAYFFILLSSTVLNLVGENFCEDFRYVPAHAFFHIAASFSVWRLAEEV